MGNASLMFVLQKHWLICKWSAESLPGKASSGVVSRYKNLSCCHAEHRVRTLKNKLKSVYSNTNNKNTLLPLWTHCMWTLVKLQRDRGWRRPFVPDFFRVTTISFGKCSFCSKHCKDNSILESSTLDLASLGWSLVVKLHTSSCSQLPLLYCVETPLWTSEED